MGNQFDPNLEPAPTPLPSEMPGVAWKPGMEWEVFSHQHDISDTPGMQPPSPEAEILSFDTARAISNFEGEILATTGRLPKSKEVAAHLASIPGLAERLGLAAPTPEI